MVKCNVNSCPKKFVNEASLCAASAGIKPVANCAYAAASQPLLVGRWMAVFFHLPAKMKCGTKILFFFFKNGSSTRVEVHMTSGARNSWPHHHSSTRRLGHQAINLVLPKQTKAWGRRPPESKECQLQVKRETTRASMYDSLLISQVRTCPILNGKFLFDYV